MGIRTVTVMRYVTPLREGGSMPAIVEADDDGTYVLKFRGAGQGPKALIAEMVAGELARACGLPVPDIVLATLAPDMARTEPDPEIQDLIRASAGLNLALDYLPGSIAFDPVVNTPPAPLASDIVWFDAFTSNVDRTPRNPNLLMWHRRLWLIDHGAALYFHHAPDTEQPVRDRFLARARAPFPPIKDHVLLPFASALPDADRTMAERLTPEVIDGIVDQIPDAFLPENGAEVRDAYTAYLRRRLEAPRPFLEEALRAHNALAPPARKDA